MIKRRTVRQPGKDHEHVFEIDAESSVSHVVVPDEVACTVCGTPIGTLRAVARGGSA